MITLEGPVSSDGDSDDDYNDPQTAIPGYRGWETHTYIRMRIYISLIMFVFGIHTVDRVRAMHGTRTPYR